MIDFEKAKEIWGALNSAPYNPENKTDRAAIFLLCAPDLNNSYLRIAQETGFDSDECRTFKRRAKTNGIFNGRKIQCAWLDKETGGIAFIMDAMLVSGILERTDQEC